jgi:hypothetical protein
VALERGIGRLDGDGGASGMDERRHTLVQHGMRQQRSRQTRRGRECSGFRRVDKRLVVGLALGVTIVPVVLGNVTLSIEPCGLDSSWA